MTRARLTGIGILACAALLATGCEPERVTITAGAAGFAGRHVGYSWAGEASGTSFADATAYIETILELDEDATIVGARMRYWQRADGYWITRQAGNAYVTVNYAVDPAPATIPEYRAGTTMFTVYTANQMSLWAAAVSGQGVAAFMLVEPLTRFRFEWKLPAGFDYSTPLSSLATVGGRAVPTVRASGGAFLVAQSWNELADRSVFDLHEYSHVLTDTGVFEGVTGSTTARELLGRMGVEFDGGVPRAMAPRYGYVGIGGWAGNYAAIEQYLIGRNARDLTSLVDWSPERYRLAINDRNQFGIDAPSGATRTVQNSVDGIAGATVRMSRESASYQRALVQAGIIAEADLVVGRF